MATFITRMADSGSGVRLAIKDLIDIAGVPTTAGSRAVAETAQPAEHDAACMAGARAAGAAVVGKVNLYELAYGASGVNEYFGTPVNPLDPERVPGGSSSGSAVVVATGEADIAYGSDTGGSIRVPAAFCGITGLKTTHGRVPLAGVWPVAPSLDTVGPMARDVAGVTAGMRLLEPDFSVAVAPASRIGRIKTTGLVVDPVIDGAVDAALRRCEADVVEVDLSGWTAAYAACNAILDTEALQSNGPLLADPARRALLSNLVLDRFGEGRTITADQLAQAKVVRRLWEEALAVAMRDVDLLVLPTVRFFPPLLAQAAGKPYTALTNPVNLAGFPALALPVPSQHRLPASLQLIGPPNSEELLLATGAVIEAAVA